MPIFLSFTKSLPQGIYQMLHRSPKQLEKPYLRIDNGIDERDQVALIELPFDDIMLHFIAMSICLHVFNIPSS